MNRRSWKSLLIGAVVVVALSSVASQADAQWAGWYRPATVWGCGYSSYYSPCYATVSCYSPCCYDDCGWYLGWRPGPVRRLLLGRYRWYWGGCWDSCCPSYATYDCCTEPGAPMQAPTPAKKPVIDDSTMPIEPQAPAAQPEPAAMPTTTNSSAAESGVLTVWVPYDAKVTINGLQTKSTGSRRQFISYGLKPGLSYSYVVRAEVVRNGEVQEDIRTVVLTAGEITAVAFGFNVSAEQVALAQ